jgi:beta-lactamase class A
MLARSAAEEGKSVIKNHLANAVTAAIVVGTVSLAFGASERTAPLERELERLSALSGGTMGIAAIHLESGRTVFLNPDDRFPMASTYKVPIAVALLQRVEAGELSLADLIEIQPWDIAPPVSHSPTTNLLDDPGVQLSLLNLLEVMLIHSDNSATDICLRKVGGGDAVTGQMMTMGVDGLRVDRATVDLIADWLGITLPPLEQITVDVFMELYEAVPEEQREAAAAAFAIDPRDTSTPRAMADLLVKIARHEILSPASCDQILDIMRRCETGPDRLKGVLPPGTEVAHKTGTIGGTTNDVGIITLPGGSGRVVLVVFIKDSTIEIPERERAIAEVARAAHDYFLFVDE